MLTLIGAGGEAVVFGDPSEQRVLKLLGTAGKAGFGWHLERASGHGSYSIRRGRLAESLLRFHLAELAFPTGLEIEAIGIDGDFLVLSQPFLVGQHPGGEELHRHLAACGWEKVALPSDLEMLRSQSWRKGALVVTDVRSENSILAESDGRIYPFDFITAFG